MKNFFLILFLCFTYSSVTVAAPLDSILTIKGVVYVDDNKNGRFDPGEKRKKNVLITNGRKVVTTNKRGEYEINIKKGQIVSVILPDSYTYNESDKWWFNSKLLQVNGLNQDKVENINFGLVKEKAKKKIKVLAVGDIQVGNREEVNFAGRTIMSELALRNDYDFSIFLGDLVNDKPALFKSVQKMMGGLQKPVWAVYGNHDRNFEGEHEEQIDSYQKIFGPATYAFFKNGILFVALNSIYPVGKFGYEGIYDKSELEFLSGILSHISTNQLIVINQHIPLAWMKNKDDILRILEGQANVLFLSAHSHTVFQSFIERAASTKIHELNVGAASGHWWTGQRDWQGNPLALMQDGTPRGYFEIEFKNNRYQIKYKGVGLSEENQMSIWIGEDGEHIKRAGDSDNRQIIVNIFAGSEKTEVNMKIDDGKWMPLNKKNIPDPFISRIKSLQKEGLYPNKGSRRSPYLNRSSRHTWLGTIPETIKPGLHKIEVAAKDNLGLNASKITWFWVE